MNAITSDASGDANVPVEVQRGTIYKLYLGSNSAIDGPTAGSVVVHHVDAFNQRDQPAYDETGTAIQLAGAAGAVGAEFTLVAHETLIRLVGSGMGNNKLVYYSLTPVI